jgi:hypothetical protein
MAAKHFKDQSNVSKELAKVPAVTAIYKQNQPDFSRTKSR